MSVPFGVAFAQSRRRAFLAGCGAGASAATVLVGALSLTAWLSGPRAENVAAQPPIVNAASKEQASPPVAVAVAVASVAAPARVEPAPPRVVVAPILVEDAAAPRTTVDRKALTAGDDETAADATPVAPDEAPEPPAVAEAEEGEAQEGAEAPAAVEHEPASAEATAAETEAPAPADEPSDPPRQIALAPAAEHEQATSDDEPGAPVDDESGR
jgi:hypothetical protein